MQNKSISTYETSVSHFKLITQSQLYLRNLGFFLKTNVFSTIALFWYNSSSFSGVYAVLS